MRASISRSRDSVIQNREAGMVVFPPLGHTFLNREYSHQEFPS